MSHAAPTPPDGHIDPSLCTQISRTQESGRWWLVFNWGSATSQFHLQLRCSPRQLLAQRGDHKSLFLNTCPTGSCLQACAAHKPCR